jgi:hypothetical protein
MTKYPNKAIDVLGKCLLAWFFYETFKYIFGGRLLIEIDQIGIELGYGSIWWVFYGVVKILVATIGPFFISVFLLKGRIPGIVLGLIYLVMGHILNPLWYIFPNHLQINSDGKATQFLHTINIIWSVVTFVIIISFFIVRKNLKKYT